MKKLTLLSALSLVLIFANAQTTLSNKDKSVALIVSLETGDHAPVAYINPNKYIQHNLAVGDGLAGFGEIMKHKPEGGFKAKVVRSFQDGDYAFLHTEYDFFGSKIGFDIFRFENGLIVEHWDNLQTTAGPNKSNHSMTDGATTVADLEKTEANKKIIKALYDEVFIKSDVSKVDQYFNKDKYIQHNPMGSDGTDFLKNALPQKWFTITKYYLVLGEGDFVLVQSEGTMSGNNSWFYDLYRIENGKIVEHWDTIETAVPKEQWKNSNGKF